MKEVIGSFVLLGVLGVVLGFVAWIAFSVFNALPH